MDKLLEDLEFITTRLDNPNYGIPLQQCVAFIRTHHSTIRDMAARLEAADRDARRYRIIRLRLWPTEVQDALDMYPVDAALHMETCEDHARQIDAAIDAHHNSAREGE